MESSVSFLRNLLGVSHPGRDVHIYSDVSAIYRTVRESLQEDLMDAFFCMILSLAIALEMARLRVPSTTYNTGGVCTMAKQSGPITNASLIRGEPIASK